MNILRQLAVNEHLGRTVPLHLLKILVNFDGLVILVEECILLYLSSALEPSQKHEEYPKRKEKKNYTYYEYYDRVEIDLIGILRGLGGSVGILCSTDGADTVYVVMRYLGQNGRLKSSLGNV